MENNHKDLKCFHQIEKISFTDFNCFERAILNHTLQPYEASLSSIRNFVFNYQTTVELIAGNCLQQFPRHNWKEIYSYNWFLYHQLVLIVVVAETKEIYVHLSKPNDKAGCNEGIGTFAVLLVFAHNKVALQSNSQKKTNIQSILTFFQVPNASMEQIFIYKKILGSLEFVPTIFKFALKAITAIVSGNFEGYITVSSSEVTPDRVEVLEEIDHQSSGSRKELRSKLHNIPKPSTKFTGGIECPEATIPLISLSEREVMVILMRVCGHKTNRSSISGEDLWKTNSLSDLSSLGLTFPLAQLQKLYRLIKRYRKDGVPLYMIDPNTNQSMSTMYRSIRTR